MRRTSYILLVAGILLAVIPFLIIKSGVLATHDSSFADLGYAAAYVVFVLPVSLIATISGLILLAYTVIKKK